MLKVSRTPVNDDYDEDNHNTIKERQSKLTKNNDTPKEPSLLPVGSTVATKCKDGGLWTNDTLIEHSDISHNSRLYKVQFMKTGRVIIRNTEHIKQTTISAH